MTCDHCRHQAIPQKYINYRPTTKIELTTGEVAPWFDSRGGGVQFVKYKPDGSMYTINEMLTNGWLEEITEVILGE